MKKKLYILICNHYDLAWRRRAYEGLEDKGRIFVSYADLQRYGITENIRFCRKYPFYKFNVESVSVLRHYLRTNPTYADELCELIRQNRCSTPQSGDNIIDVNLVSGESVVRNFTFGRAWLKEHFGEASRICVRNDAFGNCAQLPQIAKQCGCDWIWGLSYTPVSGTYWKGLDGTTLYIGQLANAGSGGSWKKYAPCPQCKGRGCEACAGLGIDRDAAERTLKIEFDPSVFDNADEALLSVTSEEMLPTETLIQWYEENRSAYDITFVTYNDLYEVVKERLTREPRSEELHNSVEHNPNNTGCYTTRIRTKQDVRRLEYRTFRLETLAALLSMQGGAYPSEDLNEIWEQLLTIMAHDIVTGEHVDGVYEDFLLWVKELDEKIDAVKEKLTVGCYAEHTVTVYNPNHVSLTDVCLIRCPDDGTYVFEDANGNNYPVLSKEGCSNRVLVKALAPSASVVLEMKCVSKTEKKTTERANVFSAEFGNVLQTFAEDQVVRAAHAGEQLCRIENERYLIESDELGLRSVYDKNSGKMLSEKGIHRPAELVYEHDEGSPWATLSPDRSVVPVDTKLVDVRIEKDYQSLVYAFEIGSTASYAIHALYGELEILLFHESNRVDFRVHLSCDDYNHRLRMLFPVSIEGGDALYGVPYGSLQREDYEPSYYWAGSNGDWCAVNWGGISNENGSVAILNRGTPSYRIYRENKQDLIAVSLLRSPSVPTYLHEPDSYSMTAWDGMRDAGTHTMELSLISYDSALDRSSVVDDAEAYNMGYITVNGTLDLPSMPMVEEGSMCLTSFHRTGDGKLAIRLVETSGKDTVARIRLPKGCHAAFLSDVIEARRSVIDVVNGTVCINAGPYEIVTLILDDSKDL